MAFAISIFSFTLAFYAVYAVKLGTSNLLESDEARLQIFPRRMLTERNGRSARRGIEKPALRAPKKASQLSIGLVLISLDSGYRMVVCKRQRG